MSKTIKICQIASGSSITDLTDMLSPWGDYEISSDCDDSFDFILGWSVTQLNKIVHALERFPKIPMINYNWDIYEWVWKTPREGEYDYKKYGEILKQSVEVWCPSEAEKDRTKKWFGIDAKVIKTSVPYEHYKDADIRDDGYILNPLRKIPDKDWGVFEKACEELGLPYRSTDHQFDYSEFRDILAGCKFVVSPLRELSTGGLSLIEGYWMGKPCLLSDSPGHGGKDYMGDRAVYYRYDDFEDLKTKLKDMYYKTPIVPNDHKKWVETNYSKKAMGKKIHEILQELYANSIR